MQPVTAIHWLRAIGGALIGAALGFVCFYFMEKNGLYAMALPGALIGMFAGRLSGVRSNAIGVLCALIGATASIFIEWKFFPFIADDSLPYFVAHLHEVKSTSLILMAIGTAFAFWFGRGRERFTPRGMNTDQLLSSES